MEELSEKEERLRQLHNSLAPELCKEILLKPKDIDGDFKDSLIILESVILGVLLMAVKRGRRLDMLDRISRHARDRLVEAEKIEPVESSERGRDGRRLDS